MSKGMLNTSVHTDDWLESGVPLEFSLFIVSMGKFGQHVGHKSGPESQNWRDEGQGKRAFD